MDQRAADKAEFALRKVSAKTARGHRVLSSRLPQVSEPVKAAAFLRGTTTSPIVCSTLFDFYSLKKPDAVFCQKRNDLHPWDGNKAEASIEFLMQKNRVAFAICATHSKKRPHNLTVVRSFDGRILDMAELGVTRYEPIISSGKTLSQVGSKPCFVVIGEQFETNEKFIRAKSLLVDLYRGRVVDSIDLLGLETCIVLTARGDDEVLFRVYRVNLKASGTSIPSVQLMSMGPSIDFRIGRTRDPSEELWKAACKYPIETFGGKRIKNVSRDPLGIKSGRVHVGQQRIESIQTRKVKALKRSKGEKRD